MVNKSKWLLIVCATICLLTASLACQAEKEIPPLVIVVTSTQNIDATVAAGISGTQTALAPTIDIPATIAAGVEGTQRAYKTLTTTINPTMTPDMSTLDGNVNVALRENVVDRAGGVNYDPWGHANDAVDYNSTTNPGGGRWGIETNAGNGSYQVIDLSKQYEITGVGYRLDWDPAYKNPLKFIVQVSNDLEKWTTVSDITHPYDGVTGSSVVNFQIPINPIIARYIKFWEPPDGAWNGWGDFFELRVYAKTEK
jgi:hypothetical protein